MKSQELIVLNREDLFKKIKKESFGVLWGLLILTMLFRLIFYKEGSVVTTKTAFLFWWMFVLPGFNLLWYWHERLDFSERLVTGAVIGLAVFGVLGYNLSILGLHLKYHVFVVPVIILFVSGIIVLKMKNGWDISK